ncbi:hypothetical protein [Microbacterium sp. GXF6406]
MTSDPAPAPRGLARVSVWEERTAWPLFAGSIVFLATLTWI